MAIKKRTKAEVITILLKIPLVDWAVIQLRLGDYGNQGRTKRIIEVLKGEGPITEKDTNGKKMRHG